MNNVNCPAGATCLFAGMTAPTPCPVGSYCLDGTAVVTCPAGSYCPTTSVINPTACPPGMYCPATGLSVPTPCAAGFYCATPLLKVACTINNYCPVGSTVPVCIFLLLVLRAFLLPPICLLTPTMFGVSPGAMSGWFVVWCRRLCSNRVSGWLRLSRRLRGAPVGVFGRHILPTRGDRGNCLPGWVRTFFLPCVFTSFLAKRLFLF